MKKSNIKLKTGFGFFFVMFVLASHTTYSKEYSQEEPWKIKTDTIKEYWEVKTDTVKVELSKVKVKNEQFLIVLDSFVLNKDYRTEYRTDEVYFVVIDSSYCNVFISLEGKSSAGGNDVFGVFWRKNTPFIVGGNNANDLFIRTSEKETFSFERTTIVITGTDVERLIWIEPLTWVFKKNCDGSVKFVHADLWEHGGSIGDERYLYDAPCCK
jgi:hypothetical protein